MKVSWATKLGGAMGAALLPLVGSLFMCWLLRNQIQPMWIDFPFGYAGGIAVATWNSYKEQK